MLVDMRGRVQKLIDDGKSVDQAVAAQPLKDLDPTWVPPGTPSFITGEAMVRQVLPQGNRRTEASKIIRTKIHSMTLNKI